MPGGVAGDAEANLRAPMPIVWASVSQIPDRAAALDLDNVPLIRATGAGRCSASS